MCCFLVMCINSDINKPYLAQYITCSRIEGEEDLCLVVVNPVFNFRIFSMYFLLVF
jgi:hypothetical protein